MLRPTNPAVADALLRGDLAAPTRQAEKQDDSFAQQLMDVINEVDALQDNARGLQQDLITNRRPVEFHDLMIAMEQASTAMQLTLAVRNKLLEAYQEINRLPV